MILEFSTVLDRRNYQTQIPKQSADNELFFLEVLARRHFHVVMKTFYSQFATKIGDEWVHPMFIVKLSLVKFAAALIAYRKNTHDDDAPCTGKELYSAIEAHFKADHDDLLPVVKSLKNASDGWLTWAGPDIHIEKRSEAVKRWKDGTEKHESRQHSLHPVY